MTTADYVFGKIVGKTINDAKYQIYACTTEGYTNCVNFLLLQLEGKKTWFNIVDSGTGTGLLAKRLIYWDLTDATYTYEIMLFLHGGLGTATCCNSNPVTAATCDTYKCINVNRITSATGAILDDQVPTTVIDEALSTLFGEVFCPMIVTKAYNPLTCTDKDYPTPCDVPSSWKLGSVPATCTIPTKYNCESGKCKGPVMDGTYDSLDACNTGCAGGIGGISGTGIVDWLKKQTCVGTTCAPNWGIAGAGAVVAYLVLKGK